MMRNSRLVILPRVLKIGWETIFPFIGFVIFLDIDLKLLFFAYGVILFILVPLISMLVWYNTFFYVKEGNFIYKKGIVFKSNTTLPLEKIANIQIEQTYLQRLSKRCTFTIDSGSGGGMEEIILTLKRNDGVKLQSLLKVVKEESVIEKVVEKETFVLTNKELLLYGLSRNSIFSFIGVFISAYFFLDNVTEKAGYDFNVFLKGEVLPVAKENPWMVVLGCTILVALIKGVTIISTYYRFYHFKITKEEEQFSIQYGYFTKKEYNVPYKKMYGIKLKQSPIFQLFHMFTIEGCLIGKNDSAGQTLLLPIASRERLDSFIHNFAPSFDYEGEYVKAERKQLRRYVVMPLTFFISFIFIASSYSKWWLFLLLLVPIMIVSQYLQYNKGCIGTTDKLLYGVTGGLYNRIYYIQLKAIQSYTYQKNYFQRKDGICTCVLPMWSGELKVKHLNEKALITHLEDEKTH